MCVSPCMPSFLTERVRRSHSLRFGQEDHAGGRSLGCLLLSQAEQTARRSRRGIFLKREKQDRELSNPHWQLPLKSDAEGITHSQLRKPSGSQRLHTRILKGIKAILKMIMYRRF